MVYTGSGIKNLNSVLACLFSIVRLRTDPWKGEPLTEELDFLLRVKGKVIIESSCLEVTGYY